MTYTPEEWDAMDKMYEDAPEYDPDNDKGEFDPLPLGSYIVTVDAVDLASVTQAGDVMLKWEFKVEAGEFKGRKHWKNSVLNEKGIPHLKKDLGRCGISLTKLSELPDRIHELIGIHLEIKLTKGKGTYKGNPNVNTWIQQRYANLPDFAGQDWGARPAPSTDDKDDIPF
jgi:hypothetical protein